MAWTKEANLRGPKGDTGAAAPNQVSGAGASGPSPLILWVGDRAEYDAIPVKDDATVYIIKDLDLQPELLELTVEGWANSMTSVGDKFYLGAGDWDSPTLFVFDAKTGGQLKAIPMSHQCSHLAAVESKSKLYVSSGDDDGAVSIVDTDTDEVIGSVTSSLRYIDTTLTVGKYLYVEATNITDPRPQDAAIGSLVPGITVIDTDTDTVVSEDAKHHLPRFVYSSAERDLIVNASEVDPDGEGVLYDGVWIMDGSNYARRYKLADGNQSFAGYLSKSGKAYCLNAVDRIVVVDMASGDTQDTGLDAPSCYSMAIVGDKLCYADNTKSQITIVDATSFSVLGSIPADWPYLFGDSKRLYVLDQNNGAVSIYNLDMFLARKN